MIRKLNLTHQPHKSPFFSAARLAAALAIGLTITIWAGSFGAFAQGCEELRHSVLRLHILANSDSESDQELKLKVRDRILELDGTLFEGAKDLASAESAAAEQLETIRAEAQEEVYRQGYDYPVHAELTNMYFTTRVYEQYTLPAGYYDAVRITIGSGEGHNWWCVLYPPLCLPAAESREDLADVLTPEELAVIEGGEEYEYRFAVVELWEKLKNLFD